MKVNFSHFHHFATQYFAPNFAKLLTFEVKNYLNILVLVSLFAGFNINLLAGVNVDAQYCQKYSQNESEIPNSDDIDKCFESDSEEEITRDYSPEEVSQITNWATNLSAAGSFTKQNIGKPLELAIIKCVLSEPTQEENPNGGWLPATQEGISQAIGFVPYAGDLGDLWTSTTGFNVITFKQAGCVDRALSGVFAGISLGTTTSGALAGCSLGAIGGPAGCAIAGGSTAISTKATTQLLKNKVLKESVKIIFKEIADNAKEMGIKLVSRKLGQEVAEKLAKEIQQDGLKMFLKRSGDYITAQLSSESFIKTAIKDGRFYVTLLNKKYVIRQFWNTITGAAKPTWRESEKAIEKVLELVDSINWKPQISFKGKDVVSYGLTGSTRPDVYNEALKLAIEVKNYGLHNPGKWQKLVTVSKEQFEYRKNNLKDGVRQKFILDIREQYLYKNPDNVAKDFAKELGIDEKMVLIIKNNEDLKKVPDFAK
jgi:hypothetical protein